MTFNLSSFTLEVNIEFSASVPETIITASFPSNIASMISTPLGKSLSNHSSDLNFEGFIKNDKSLLFSLGGTEIISSASGAVSSASTGLVIISSFFSNSFSFLSKMIQIIEFTAFMELYNVHYDHTLGSILRFISETTEVEILEIDTTSVIDDLEYTRAGIFKGKLTEIGVKPYLFQNLDYPGVILILIYLLDAFFRLIDAPKTRIILTKLRYSLFSTLFIDYIGFMLRNVGHHPLRTGSDNISKASYFVACFLVICFTLEMQILYFTSNSLYKKVVRRIE